MLNTPAWEYVYFFLLFFLGWGVVIVGGSSLNSRGLFLGRSLLWIIRLGWGSFAFLPILRDLIEIGLLNYFIFNKTV